MKYALAYALAALLVCVGNWILGEVAAGWRRSRARRGA
jgi:hypothetical protein